MKIEVIKTEEEAYQYIAYIKEKMGLVDLKKLIGEDNDKQNSEDFKSLREKVVDAIRVGLIIFDDANKGITQRLIDPIEYSGNIIEEITFFKKLKVVNIKGLRDGNEIEQIIKNIAAITNLTQDKVENMTQQDFNISLAIYTVFLQ